MGGGLDVEGDLRREGGEPKDARAVCQGTLKRYPDLPLLHRGPRTSLRNRCCGAPLLPHLLLHPPRVHWRRSFGAEVIYHSDSQVENHTRARVAHDHVASIVLYSKNFRSILVGPNEPSCLQAGSPV